MDDATRSLIRRLWKEGDFFIDERFGPSVAVDGLCYEVEFPEDERVVLDEALKEPQ